MQAGIRAAFEEANKAGGVKGRKLELVSIDDGYEPNKSIEATKKLLDEHKVFALIGPVGTPTSAATQPIALQAGVPFIGPFTGAEFLRNPFQPNVVNVRGSYFQETEAMVERLTKDRGITRISIFYQDDAFGRAGLAGVQKALAKRNMQLASEGTFERNTVAVKGALLSIQKGKPEAVIMVGPYRPCAEFIKLARQVKLDAVLVNISFVGSNALAKEAGRRRRRRGRHAGRALPGRHLDPAGCPLPGGAEGDRAPTRSRASSRSRATWSAASSSPRWRRCDGEPTRRRCSTRSSPTPSTSAASSWCTEPMTIRAWTRCS